MEFYTLLFIKFFLVLIGSISVLVTIFGVPFVPTHTPMIRKILDLLNLKDGMTVIEFGSGDARFLTMASKRAHIKAIGYELSPMVWFLSIIRKFFYRGKNVHIILGNYLAADISEANVLFFYLLPARMKKVEEKLRKEGKKGTIVVSYAFRLKGLESKLTQHIPYGNGYSSIFFYTL